MGESSLIYVCPICRSNVELLPEEYVCPNGHRFRTHLGIPDFRTFDPPYVSKDEEARRVELLMESYESMSFRELVSLYQREVAPEDEPETLVEQHIRYRSTAAQRGTLRVDKLSRLLSAMELSFESKSRALDLGCGTGGHLVALGREYEQVVGVDIALEELILARKNLQENGLANVDLVCACSEALPFRDSSFGFCHADGVVEHVESHRDFLAETYRVLGPKGILSFSSPNRFTILKEPHVQVWGVGFLPKRLASAYVSLMRGIPYEAKDPMSFLELNRLLRETYKRDFRIFTIPGTTNMSEPGSTTRGRAYRKLHRIPLIKKLMRLIETCFLPVFEVIALRKADEAAPFGSSPREVDTG